jgi:phosphoribosylamine-glycine ligase
MTIIVLAGGSDQIALINELKKRGHYTVLVDYFENPPAKMYADKHIVASTLDTDRVKEIAVSEKADLICTACTDQALLSVAKVSEELGLPCYISYQTGLNVTNKLYMKKVLVNNNIPTSRYVILDKMDSEALKGFSCPLVVKPVDCNSSKGVKRIDNIEELPTYLNEAINYSRTKTAIVEEFKEGTEISADFYIENGVAKYLSATTSLKIKNRKSFTILCSDYPAINNSQKEKLTTIVSQIAKAFNLDNCPMLVQLIANGDDMWVLEFSARMGGGSKHNLIKVLSDVDIMSVYVDRILGDYPSIHPSEPVKYCKMIYIYCKPGIFNYVDGFESLQKEGIIDTYFHYKTSGMEIHGSETSSDRPAGYLITASTPEELAHKLQYADSHLAVISADGEDIMLHNLLS